MFERFTDRARRIVVLAQEESRLLHHNYIGSEHLLLGLLHEGEGVAAVVLTRLGVSLNAARAAVEVHLGPGASSLSGQIPFTPRAKKVLDLSLRESLQLGHNYIGTEHILLGLIREGEGVAASVLVNNFGINLASVRHETIHVLAGFESALVRDEPGKPMPPPSSTVVSERMSVTLGDDEVLAFIGWVDHFSETNGPLADGHPLMRVRRALRTRTRPMLHESVREEVEHMGGEAPQEAPDEGAPAEEPTAAPEGDEPESAPDAAPEE